MNIFILSNDPIEAAQMMCDAHVVKMVTESAQMLSTAHRVLDGVKEKRASKSGKRMLDYWKVGYNLDSILMKPCHVNHPCTQWAMKSNHNYNWLYRHYEALSNEYTYRYGKEHGAFYKNSIHLFLRNTPFNIPITDEITPYAIAMKQYPECITESAIESYRKYYLIAKQSFAKWTNRTPPLWWNLTT